jgi:hypothetical protein
MWLVHQFDSLFHLGVCKEYPIMAKTKTPRTASSRNKKNGTDLPITPVIAATAETAAGEPASLEVQVPVTPIAVAKTAEVKAVEPKELRKPLSEVRRTVVPINLEEEIRRLAYQLYEERGCTPGHENDDWLFAEREILSRYTTQLHRSASA